MPEAGSATVFAYVDERGAPVPYDGVSQARWRVAAYVLAVRDGKVLVVEPMHTPLWELPGGAVHVEELMVEGAARECLEETGYAFKSDGVMPFHVGEGFVCWDPRHGCFHTLAAIFSGTVEGDPEPFWQLDPNEIRKVAWLAPQDFTAENTHPNFWHALKRTGLVG